MDANLEALMEANKSWFTPEALAEDKLRVANLRLNQAREALNRELTYALRRKDKGTAARIQADIHHIFGPPHDGTVEMFDDFCKALDALTNAEAPESDRFDPRVEMT